jgi:hypothetical protein
MSRSYGVVPESVASGVKVQEVLEEYGATSFGDLFVQFG